MIWLTVFAHIGLLSWLWQQGAVQRVARTAAPLMVHIVAPSAEPAPRLQALAPPLARPPSLPALAVPPIVAEAVQAPAFAAEPTALAPDTGARSDAAPPAVSVAAVAVIAPSPPPAATVQRVPASALRYRVEPPVAVPRLSRRLRESGTVLLHVVVDVLGQPREVSLRRSSGFARLDEQALGAMRQARFVPCTADGRPVECEADAPIVYELENGS